MEQGGPAEVEVKCKGGSTLHLRFEPNETLAALQTRIAEAAGVPANAQRLIHRGKLLKAKDMASTLDSLGVVHEPIILMSARPPPANNTLVSAPQQAKEAVPAEQTHSQLDEAQLHAMLLAHPGSRAVMEAHPELMDLQLLKRVLEQAKPVEQVEEPTRVKIEEDSEESDDDEGKSRQIQPKQSQSPPAPPPAHNPAAHAPRPTKKKKKQLVPLSDCADSQLRLCVQWLRRQLVNGELGYQLLWQHILDSYEWMLVGCASTVSWHNAFKYKILRWEDLASEAPGVGKKWGEWDDFVGRVGEHGLPVAAKGLRLRRGWRPMRLRWEYKNHKCRDGEDGEREARSVAEGGAEDGAGRAAAGKTEEEGEGVAWNAQTQALGLEILMSIPTDVLVGEMPKEEADKNGDGEEDLGGALNGIMDENQGDDDDDAAAVVENDDWWVELSESDADVVFAACIHSPVLEAAVRRDRLRDRREKTTAAAGVAQDLGAIPCKPGKPGKAVAREDGREDGREEGREDGSWVAKDLERKELERGIISVIGAHTRLRYAQPPGEAHLSPRNQHNFLHERLDNSLVFAGDTDQGLCVAIRSFVRRATHKLIAALGATPRVVAADALTFWAEILNTLLHFGRNGGKWVTFAAAESIGIVQHPQAVQSDGSELVWPADLSAALEVWAKHSRMDVRWQLLRIDFCSQEQALLPCTQDGVTYYGAAPPPVVHHLRRMAVFAEIKPGPEAAESDWQHAPQNPKCCPA
jgi:hypothetical protein